MFSALRQLKSAHLLLIAAKMAGTETPACRMALALIRPALHGELFLRLTRHDGAVDFEATSLGDHFMEAKGFVQHFRVR